MKMGIGIALIALGAGAVMACQKYYKPVMEKVEETAGKALKKKAQELDNMM